MRSYLVAPWRIGLKLSCVADLKEYSMTKLSLMNKDPQPSGRIAMGYDLSLLVLAEACISYAAASYSYDEVFKCVDTVKDIENMPEREINSFQLASVLNIIIRKISEGDMKMHESIVDYIYEFFEESKRP
jgi:hypothetical protein